MSDPKRLRWLAEEWPDWLTDTWQRLLCFAYSHVPIPDQCNIPEHDYCAWCRKPLPRKARYQSEGNV